MGWSNCHMVGRMEAARKVLIAGYLFLAAGVAFSSAAAATIPGDTDTYVERAMRTFGVPGLSLAIVQDGKIALAKGYGVRQIGTAGPVDAHSTFPIGSESKAFTSAALAILVDRKKLRWDDLVKDRLPGFQMYDPYATAHMTVRDLLTHRSGLGLGEGDLMLFPDTNRSRADIVHALRYLKPATGFREAYAYDNILYIVAGALVEAVSGQSWEDFVTQNIFQPVGMRDAHTNYDRSAGNEVLLHARMDGLFEGVGHQAVLARVPAHALAPAGGINASATDLARWMNVQLARGKLPNGRQLFSLQQANTMWEPVVVVPPEGPHRVPILKPDMQSYALGWFVEEYRGHKIVRHTGAVGGALAALYLIPDKDTGIAVTINSEDGMAMIAVLFHLLDHYLALPPTDWIAELNKVQSQAVAKARATMKTLPGIEAANGAKLPLDLSAYAGRYQDPWYGNMTIRDRGQGKLWISFDRTPGMEGALEPVFGNKFRTRWTDKSIEDAYVSFSVKDNKISDVSMAVISPVADFSSDYQDLHFVPAPK
jgi:CubicO group peptidase (beta-lactamase class C family)